MTDKFVVILGTVILVGAMTALVVIAEYRKTPKPPFPICQQRSEP